MGGHVPMGYIVRDRELVVNEAEAALVRHIFARFLQVGSATKLVQELNAAGHRTKRGKPFDKGVVYKLLNNRTYVGEVSIKAWSTPVSMKRWSTGRPGTRFTPSSPRTAIAAPATHAPPRLPCSRA